MRGRSQTIALLVPDLENPMFQGILKGLTVAAARDGYRVLVADSAEAVGVEAEIASEARSKCDALVLVSPRMPDPELRELIQRTTPVVVVNRRVDDTAAAQLSVDYGTAVKELGVHLMGFGHRRIVYVAGPPLSYANELRAMGLGELTRDHPDLEILTVSAGSSMEAGYDAADAVLETGATAAIAFNDLVALGLLSRLREVGVEVPEQLSIVGMDDIPQSRFAVPPLTTMSVPRIEIGRQAWNRMRQALEGETADHPLFYRPVLVPRRSSGPASHASGWVGPARPVLRLGSTVVAQYEEGATVDSVLSPRPFLDNVVSRRGTPLTVTEPTDHPHHLGVSLAIPDVNGTSYWGGRTYVRGEGSIMVPNHGRQRRDDLRIDGHSLHERLSWVDHTGTTQLVEVRELAFRRTGERLGAALAQSPQGDTRRDHVRVSCDERPRGCRLRRCVLALRARDRPRVQPSGRHRARRARGVDAMDRLHLPGARHDRDPDPGGVAAPMVRALRGVPRRGAGRRVGRIAHDSRRRRAEPRADGVRPRRGTRRRGRGGAGPAGTSGRSRAVSDLLRLGIAGVHGHGRSHVEAALAGSSGVELVAVADPRGGGDVPRTTREYADAVDMLDAGGLDLVVLCTPIPTHADLTLRALAGGLHVLLEKPPVVSVAEHERVAKAAEGAGRAVQVGFQSLGSAGVDCRARSCGVGRAR